MRDMVAQHLFLDLAQGGAHRADLRHDVDAVAITLDHARKAAHLAFDPFQPPERCSLGFCSHGLKYTPRGYKFQVCHTLTIIRTPKPHIITAPRRRGRCSIPSAA